MGNGTRDPETGNESRRGERKRRNADDLVYTLEQSVKKSEIKGPSVIKIQRWWKIRD